MGLGFFAHWADLQIKLHISDIVCSPELLSQAISWNAFQHSCALALKAFTRICTYMSRMSLYFVALGPSLGPIHVRSQVYKAAIINDPFWCCHLPSVPADSHAGLEKCEEVGLGVA